MSRVDRQRNRDVAADEKSAAARAIENATGARRRARTELRNQQSSHAALPLEKAGCRRRGRGSSPDRPGMPYVVPEDPKIVYQVTRGSSAALPAPSIEGADLLLSLKPVVADNVERIRQIKLMRLATAIAIHVGPVIGHQPIERVP